MIIAVTGGRDNHLTPKAKFILTHLIRERNISELHHGACRGIDSEVAYLIHKQFPYIKVVAFKPDWNKYGFAAGPVRNKLMLEGCSMLLAYPGGKGTANCIHLAKKMKEITILNMYL